MRNKLALIIALASFGVVTALGVGLAGADSSPTPNRPAAPRRPRPRRRPARAAARLLERTRRRRRRPRRPRRPRLPRDPPTTSEEPAPAAPPAEAEAAASKRPGRRPNPRGRVEPRRRHGDRAAAAARSSTTRASATSAGGGGGASGGGQRARARPAASSRRRPAPAAARPTSSGGSPTAANPTTTIAPFGPAPIGVPNFVIDSFEIPPFLLPIYQACGTEYGIPWEVLASINKIETAFGTNLNVSSAGAIGWMQFIPSSWEAFGRRRQRRRPQGPLQPGRRDLRRRQLPEGSAAAPRTSTTRSSPTTTPTGTCRRCSLYARAYGKLPSRPGRLADRAHRGRPLPGRRRRQLRRRPLGPRGAEAGDAGRARGLRQRGRRDRLLADPARHQHLRRRGRAGRRRQRRRDREDRAAPPSSASYVVLEDAYGNRYTYAELGKIVRKHRKVVMPTGKEKRVPVDSENIRPRLFALPGREGAEPQKVARESVDSGDRDRRRRKPEGRVEGDRRHGSGPDRRRRPTASTRTSTSRSARPAAARRGSTRSRSSTAGSCSRRRRSTAPTARTRFAQKLGSAGVLLLSKEVLQQRVLADKRLEIYECGRTDIATGQIDRRVLATLEYLVRKGFDLTITSLKCGHSFLTTSGNVSDHSYRQRGRHRRDQRDPGHSATRARARSPTSCPQRRCCRLQGTMAPDELISLEELRRAQLRAAGPLRPRPHRLAAAVRPLGHQVSSMRLLKPDQWNA